MPPSVQALQLVLTSVLELDAGACHEVNDGSGYEHLSGASESGHARRDDDADTCYVITAQFDLGGVDAAADLDPHASERVSDHQRRADCSCRTVEDGEHAVAGVLDLTTAEPRQGPGHDIVM